MDLHIRTQAFNRHSKDSANVTIMRPSKSASFLTQEQMQVHAQLPMIMQKASGRCPKDLLRDDSRVQGTHVRMNMCSSMGSQCGMNSWVVMPGM